MGKPFRKTVPGITMPFNFPWTVPVVARRVSPPRNLVSFRKIVMVTHLTVAYVE